MTTSQNQLGSISMSDEEEAFGYAWCLRSSDMFCFVLVTTIQLGIFDIMAKVGSGAHLSSFVIASHIHANNPQAASLFDRMLRLLAGYGLVTPISRKLEGNDEKNGGGDNKKAKRLYRLVSPSKAFVHDENRGSLVGFAFSKGKIVCYTLI